MPSDLYAERLRVVSGSSAWTVSTMTGSNPNGIASEPTGSLLRTPDGGIWINSNGGTEWQRLGAGVITGSYTALGTEGSQATVTLPVAFASNQYRVFLTNVSGSSVSAYQVPETLRTTTTFKINSTSPFSLGDKLDYLAVSGSIYAGSGGVSSGGGGTSTTGTLSISSGSVPATLDLSTEGNIDWFAMPTMLQVPRSMGSSAGGAHYKRIGGWIMESFSWNMAGQAFNMSQVSSGTPVKTSTATDTAGLTTLNTANSAWMFTTSSPTNGWGYTFKIPACARSQTVRLYMSQYSCVFKWTAHLTDFSAPDVSVNTSTGSGGAANGLVTITFNSSGGGYLVVTGECVGRYTTDPYVMFLAATASGNL